VAEVAAYFFRDCLVVCAAPVRRPEGCDGRDGVAGAGCFFAVRWLTILAWRFLAAFSVRQALLWRRPAASVQRAKYLPHFLSMVSLMVSGLRRAAVGLGIAFVTAIAGE